MTIETSTFAALALNPRPRRCRTQALSVLAALALPVGSAHAQSSVTLYGVAEASIVRGDGSLGSKTQLFSGSSLGTRLGFRGIEDLGGGMSARFVLESGFGLDTGAGITSNANNQASGQGAPGAGGQGLTFNRLSYVGLAGGWGEVRLGRDYTPAWRAQSTMDPAAISVGLWSPQSALGSLAVLPNAAGVRASNSVGYHTPVIGGFTAQFMYALGENASNAGAARKDGDVFGVRVAYTRGALNMVVATETIKLAAVGDIKETVVGANYDFGVAKLWAQYLRDRTELGNKMHGHALSVSAPFGPMELRAGWSRSEVETVTGKPAGTINKIALFGIYHLSKRTALYTTVARVRNQDGTSSVPYPGVAVTAPNTSANAYEFGMRHAF